MVNTSVLKIESEGKTLLVSRNAKQEVCPISKNIISKNINSELIETNRKMKFKTIIETRDNVNVSALKCFKKFEIYSIVKFMQPNSEEIPKKFVEDSIEKGDEFTIYRPIFEMVLTNVSCKAETDNGQIWKLEFEEI